MFWLGRCKQPFGLSQTLSSDSSDRWTRILSSNYWYSSLALCFSGTTEANTQGFQHPFTTKSPACLWLWLPFVSSFLLIIKDHFALWDGIPSLLSFSDGDCTAPICRILLFPFYRIIPTNILQAPVSPNSRHVQNKAPLTSQSPKHAISSAHLLSSSHQLNLLRKVACKPLLHFTSSAFLSPLQITKKSPKSSILSNLMNNFLL